MFIEFSCPVCQSPLSLKQQATGGQVNCPNCQKLILLPSESPLSRHDPETPPYQEGQHYTASEVTQALCTSVEPYRLDLETKAKLLDDAVEMIKSRNERIKEVETHTLTIQKELWELEVALDEVQTPTPTEDQDHDADRPENQESIFKELDQLAHSFQRYRESFQEGTQGLKDAKEKIKTLMATLEECSARLDVQEKNKA